MTFKKFAKDFGSKEIVLNYANRRWGLTKTNKVGEVIITVYEPKPPKWKTPTQRRGSK